MLAEASSAQDKAQLAAVKALLTNNDALRAQVAEVRRELKSLRAARQSPTPSIHEMNCRCTNAGASRDAA